MSRNTNSYLTLTEKNSIWKKERDLHVCIFYFYRYFFLTTSTLAKILFINHTMRNDCIIDDFAN